MKFILILLLSISAMYAVSFSFLESALSNSPKLPSAKHEVSAYGFNFRQYTWIDPAGRICTVVFTDSKGGAPDCEFPPDGFDYAKFSKKLSN